MNLLRPSMFRLKAEQDDWLKSCAKKQGHGNKSLALRLLLDRMMRREAKLKGAA